MEIKKKGALLTFEAITYTTIILIVIFLGIFGFSEYVELAKHDVVQADLVKISAAVSRYNYDVGNYPDTLTKLTEKKDDDGPWLDELPQDPWHQDYEYKISSDKKRFAVYSKMKDGKASAPDVNSPKDNSKKTGLALYVIAH